MLRPRWNVVPTIADCQSLGGEERLVKSYHIRVQRPKYPWILLVVFLVLFNLSYLAQLTPLANELRRDGPVGFFSICLLMSCGSSARLSFPSPRRRLSTPCGSGAWPLRQPLLTQRNRLLQARRAK